LNWITTITFVLISGYIIWQAVQGYLILVLIRACTKHPFGLCGPDG
jgi:hypothetical protein